MNELRVRGGALRFLGLMAFVTTLVVVSSGCTGSANKSSSSTSSSTTKPTTVIKISNAPRTSNYVGARKDVTNLSCAQDGHLWKVAGKIINPTNAVADYRIFTAFLDQANATRGLLQTDVKGLAPQVQRSWSGQLELTGTGLRCVLRVERTGVNGAPPPTEPPSTTTTTTKAP
jgi:hypothetical protein